MIFILIRGERERSGVAWGGDTCSNFRASPAPLQRAIDGDFGREPRLKNLSDFAIEPVELAVDEKRFKGRGFLGGNRKRENRESRIREAKGDWRGRVHLNLPSFG